MDRDLAGGFLRSDGITPMSGAPLILGGLAMDGAGDAVFAGRSSASPSLLTVGYRQGANGAFVLRTYPSFGASVVSTRVAINESGMAAVVLRVGTTLLAITRSGRATGRPRPRLSRRRSRWLEDPAIGVDGAGNVLVAFTYQSAALAFILRTALRSPLGTWTESGDLSRPP